MDILLVIVVLLLALLLSVWSCASSYFERGRLRGLKQAAREITRGAQMHFVGHGAEVHDKVIASTTAVNGLASTDGRIACEPLLWAFGDAIGEACWQRGHDIAVRDGATPDGRIRVELTVAELQQLSWLAHLGFQHMMPNYRGFEIHRFSDAEDAREGARSVAVLECALPVHERPFADIKTQIHGRDSLISGWWATPERRTA